MIELKEISKTYKTKKGVKTLALDDVSFLLPNKGMIFILGKSGSGKSTLLNLIGGLDKYNSGEIIIDGKSTKKFKSKDFDYYRNTYIGFIFQEFNLLEEYNVYDNIILSRKLQKEQISIDTINDLLVKVGIEGLGKRRPNELSGGQKGRVAIARALIKNPEIILADEPTGNLDEETGKQIFQLLKSIAKEKLVIVVSHDRDSANLYADGIIEIADGKIISNNVSIREENKRDFKAKKSKLPFLSSLKFAFLNLKSHKVKLFFTILLVFMSIVFFGTSKILSKFEIEKSHAKTMKENNNQYITLKKGEYNDYDKSWYDGEDYIEFTKEDLESVQKKIDSPYAYKYLLNENNELLQFDIDYKGMMTEDLTVYYLLIPKFFTFIETDENFIEKQIIGTYPKNNDEIMIHSYLADFIMRQGIMLYEENPNQFKKEYYKPTNYEDFMDKYYKYGSTKLKISGIIIDDTSRFSHLKEIPYKQQMGVNQTWLGVPSNNNKIYEFNQVVQMNALDVYVAKGFIENLNLKSNTTIDSSYYSVSVKKNEKSDYISGALYRYLENKIRVFDGENMITVETLKDNEIIVPETYLDEISKREYTKLKEQYMKAYQEQIRKLEEENRKINAENKKILDVYYQKIEQGIEVEEPTLQEEKEILYKDEEELKQEFLKNFLKENGVLNGTVSLIFNHNYYEKETVSKDNLTIVGIELDGSDVYIPRIVDELMRDNYYICNLLIKESDWKKIENLLTIFPQNSPYIGITTYTSNIRTVSASLENVAFIAQYASYIFGFFAFILLTNFIVTSIYYNKKTIGILRGLGARKIDVFKIFLNEGLLIGMISLFLSIITLFIAIFITNSYISSHLFFDINFITFTNKNLFIIIVSVLGIIFISSLFTVRRIAKMNPVDAILNK